MSSQTSAPYPATAGVARRSKSEMMRQWRRRAAMVQWIPGLFWLLCGLAVLLDLALVAGVVPLVGGWRSLPCALRAVLPGRALGPAGPAGFFGDAGRHLWLGRAQPLHKAWIFSLSAALFMGGFLAAGRHGWPARWLSYALGGVGLLLACFWSGLAVCYRVSLIGPSPLATLNEWLLWVGFLTAVLGLAGELATRRGWMALGAALVGGLLLLAAEQWPSRLPDTATGLQGVLCSRWGLLLPGIVLVAGYAALTLAWALGSLNLVAVLVVPGRAEPAGTLAAFACRWLQIGLTLLASAALLDSSWGVPGGPALWGWQPGDVWAMCPLFWTLLVLLARYHGWLDNFGVTLWAVVGFSVLVCVWACGHLVPGACLWACWAGLLGCSLAVHVGLRYLFGRAASVLGEGELPSFSRGSQNRATSRGSVNRG